MPYFNFDLVIDEEFKGQGGMILEDTQGAFERAESLASELSVVRRDRGDAPFGSPTARTGNSVGLLSILSRCGSRHVTTSEGSSIARAPLVWKRVVEPFGALPSKGRWPATTRRDRRLPIPRRPRGPGSAGGVPLNPGRRMARRPT